MWWFLLFKKLIVIKHFWRESTWQVCEKIFSLWKKKGDYFIHSFILRRRDKLWSDSNKLGWWVMTQIVRVPTPTQYKSLQLLIDWVSCYLKAVRLFLILWQDVSELNLSRLDDERFERRPGPSRAFFFSWIADNIPCESCIGFIPAYQ